jgi:hypothetical protein
MVPKVVLQGCLLKSVGYNVCFLAKIVKVFCEVLQQSDKFYDI